MVVGVYGADGSGDKFPPSAGGAVSFRRWRSGLIPQLHVGRLTLVSCFRTGASVERVLDGDCDGRCAGSPDCGFDRAKARMARGILRVRFFGRFLECDLVWVVPRFSCREERRLARGAGKNWTGPASLERPDAVVASAAEWEFFAPPADVS